MHPCICWPTCCLRGLLRWPKILLGDTADRVRMTLEFVRERVMITDGQTPFEIKGPDGFVVITLSSKTEVCDTMIQQCIGIPIGSGWVS